MVSNCYVVGCTNYVGKKAGLHFYSFPSDAQWREKWVAAVQEKTGNLANNVCMLIVCYVSVCIAQQRSGNQPGLQV